MEIRRTITSIFMVPTLQVPRNSLTENGFLNAYSKDTLRDEQFQNSIYLLFRPKQIDKFREFLDSEYERTPSIIDDYDYPNEFVVVVYKLNEHFNTDFELIRVGKYSKTSREFQELFPKTVTIFKDGALREEVSLQYRIFNKTSDLLTFWEEKFDEDFDSDQELWEGFHEENEELTQKTLDQYVSQD